MRLPGLLCAVKSFTVCTCAHVNRCTPPRCVASYPDQTKDIRVPRGSLVLILNPLGDGLVRILTFGGTVCVAYMAMLREHTEEVGS